MNASTAILLVSCFAASAVSGCSSNEKPKEAAPAATASAGQPLTVEDSIDVTVTAKVKAINQATRVVTLQDEAGNESTLVVSNDVKRLNEVMAGDRVKVRYQASLLAELRAPTADEAAHPITAVEVAGRAPRSATPGAGIGQGVKVVTTVEAVDVPNMLVTLRGPLGDLAVVKGRKPENVKRLRVGDTIVITYAEAMAISLEKIASK